MNLSKLYVKLLSDKSIAPSRGSSLSAGYDLHSTISTKIGPHSKCLVPTGISIQIPHSHYARIAPRSGLAWKSFIDVGAGVVDEDYRGEVKVILINLSDVDFVIQQGDRIAQLILEKCTYADVQVVQELDQTARGEGGFGSTGVTQSNLVQSDNQSIQSNNIFRSRISEMVTKGLIQKDQQDMYYDRIQKAVKIGNQLNDFMNTDQNEKLIQILRELREM